MANSSYLQLMVRKIVFFIFYQIISFVYILILLLLALFFYVF